MDEKAGSETPIFEVLGSKPIRSKVLLHRGLFLFILLHFIQLLFVVFSLVNSLYHLSHPLTMVNLCPNFYGTVASQRQN